MSELNVIEATPREAEGAGPGGTDGGSRFLRANLILLYFLVASVVIWVLTGFYQVRADEVALVERLGSYVSTEGKAVKVGPGLHYHLPWPIDRVHVVSTQQRFSLPVKGFNVTPAEYEDFKEKYLKDENNPFRGSPEIFNFIFNPYLIAGDKSMAHMEIVMNFKVRDPEAWLNSVSHEYKETYEPEAAGDMRNQLLQQIAHRAMIKAASQLSFMDLLLTKRDTLSGTLQTSLTEAMVIDTADANDPTKRAEIDLGIQIESVQVTVVRPPDQIKAPFQNVLDQQFGRDTQKSQATFQANSMKTAASAEAQTMKISADQYKASRLQESTGERDRFKQVLAQYEAAPELTRWNLYGDAMTSVLTNSKRIFFVTPGSKTYVQVDPPQPDASKAGPRQ